MWNGGKITQLGRHGHHAYCGVALAIWQANLALGAGRTHLIVVFLVSAKAVGAGDAPPGERFPSSGLEVPHPASNRAPVRKLIGVRR
jgi:hypothetical protein